MGSRVDELALDHCFWRAISTDQTFQRWFLARSRFSDRQLELVTDELWHQRWYRDPETRKDSETDILLIFRDLTSGDRYAFHVENKPDHGIWKRDQAAEYRKRAINRMSKWRYVDFQTALLAPLSFIRRWPEEAKHFDIHLAYEDVRNFAPEFAILPHSN